MAKPIPADTLLHCADALRVLAHPARLRMVELLDSKRLSVGELAAQIGKPPAEVSQHLTKMKTAGLVSVERDARCAYYRVTNPACLAVLGCIRKHFVK